MCSLGDVETITCRVANPNTPYDYIMSSIVTPHIESPTAQSNTGRRCSGPINRNVGSLHVDPTRKVDYPSYVKHDIAMTARYGVTETSRTRISEVCHTVHGPP